MGELLSRLIVLDKGIACYSILELLKIAPDHEALEQGICPRVDVLMPWNKVLSIIGYRGALKSTSTIYVYLFTGTCGPHRFTLLGLA